MRVLVAAMTVAAFAWMAALPCAAELKGAAAVRVVTPDPLLPLSGGTSAAQPATQKQGDLTVRALVLEQDGTRVAIVEGDFLGFPGVLCSRVRAQVKDVPAENILIGSTHCHSAPDMYGFINERGEIAADMKYIDSVCVKMAEAVNEAVANLQPAVAKINTDEAKGKIAYNYYAPQLYDPRMSVIQIIATGGAPIATLVNYATHPEIIGNEQGILSPDLCGPLYDRIQEKGGGIGIFVNSAQGGMVTADCRGPEKDIQTWEECIRIGGLMADEALRIVAAAPVQENPVLFCKAMTIAFPVESELLRMVMGLSPLGLTLSANNTIDAQVNVINFGDAQILTIPGEALPNVGYYLKRHMHGRSNMLFGLTNDALGYMLAKVDWQSFERYEYISETCLGEMTAELLMEKGLAFVESCPRPEGGK